MPETIDDVSKDPLHRAKTYPYPIPHRSYIFRDGRPHWLESNGAVPNLERRSPVLAVGSNQSPEQLARKFEGHQWGDIPVLRIVLHGFDSVYSPHVASYGAIAATLQEAGGVAVSLFVTWLKDEQLARMHETEIHSANYGFGRLRNLQINAELGPSLDSLFIYNSTRGTLCHDGEPIAVAEVAAGGRTWRSMTQMEVQHHVRDRLAAGSDPDDFIRQSIADPALRRQRSDTLKLGARPFNPPNFEKIPI